MWIDLLVVFSLLHSFAEVTMGTQTCALYDPPSPGLHCYHGDQVLQDLTASKWAWMLELYSSWCGHCQNFAPRLKELAQEIEPWSDVVRIGVLECTGSKENQVVCNKMDIQGYPTIRFFKPFDPSPLQYKNVAVGARSVGVLRQLIVDHVTSMDPYPVTWPNFQLLKNDSLLEAATGWVPAVLVFEEERSFIGKELILDFSKVKALRIRRVWNQNMALVQHYSILEFPSAVVEFTKGHYHIIPGHSVEDARSEFKERIAGYLREAGAALPGKSHDKRSTLSHPQDQSHHTKPHPLRNRVERHDLLSAISYALRAEVPLHAIISGSTYSALFNFVSLLEQAFTGVSHVGVAASLRAVRVKLEERSQAGFITSKEWHRIMDSKLDSTLFPTRVSWRMCNGSRPHLRGYPCGLWLLMHTLTVLTLPLNHTHSAQPHPITTTRALTIVANFIKNFFSCEVCRQHFTEMCRSLSHHPLTDPGDTILWLWEAHNTVSARLSREKVSGDSLHPKYLFPSISRCPYCYLVVPGPYAPHRLIPGFNNTKFASGESLLVQMGRVDHSPRPASRNMLYAPHHQENSVNTFIWNRTAVLLYLWNYYHLNRLHGNGNKAGMEYRHHSVSQSAILQAAWPQTLYFQKEWRRAADSEVCMLPYVLCVLVFSLLLWGLWHKRRCRALTWLRVFPW